MEGWTATAAVITVAAAIAHLIFAFKIVLELRKQGRQISDGLTSPETAEAIGKGFGRGMMARIAEAQNGAAGKDAQVIRQKWAQFQKMICEKVLYERYPMLKEFAESSPEIMDFLLANPQILMMAIRQLAPLMQMAGNIQGGVQNGNATQGNPPG
jgi:hypothetical protein